MDAVAADRSSENPGESVRANLGQSSASSTPVGQLLPPRIQRLGRFAPRPPLASSKASKTRRGFNRVFHCLKSGGERYPFIMAEISMTSPGSDDQGIVANFLIVRLHDPSLQVEPRDLASALRYFSAAAEWIGWLCNLPGTDRCRHLIQQRLEGVKILPINDGDFRVRARQRLGRVQAAEARSCDHHPMCNLAVLICPSCATL